MSSPSTAPRENSKEHRSVPERGRHFLRWRLSERGGVAFLTFGRQGARHGLQRGQSSARQTDHGRVKRIGRRSSTPAPIRRAKQSMDGTDRRRAAGGRMMRRSASTQNLNVSGPRPVYRWRLRSTWPPRPSPMVGLCHDPRFTPRSAQTPIRRASGNPGGCTRGPGRRLFAASSNAARSRVTSSGHAASPGGRNGCDGRLFA